MPRRDARPPRVCVQRRAYDRVVIDISIYAEPPMISSGPSSWRSRSICIHRSYGIKYTRHVHESDNCHSSYADVSINREEQARACSSPSQRPTRCVPDRFISRFFDIDVSSSSSSPLFYFYFFIFRPDRDFSLAASLKKGGIWILKYFRTIYRWIEIDVRTRAVRIKFKGEEERSWRSVR